MLHVSRGMLNFARMRPIVAALLLSLIIATPIMVRASLLDSAYRSSPEGKAEAARRAEADANEGRINIAQTMVTSRLRDPASAQFLGSRVVRKEGKEAVCGFVNSKNGFGGMVGNEAFVVVGIDVYFAGQGREAVEQMKKFCGY